MFHSNHTSPNQGASGSEKSTISSTESTAVSAQLSRAQGSGGGGNTLNALLHGKLQREILKGAGNNWDTPQNNGMKVLA